MPTNRRRRRNGRRLDVREMTPDLSYELLHGLYLFQAVPDDDLRAAWEEHGETILPLWIKHFPGTRPFGWWLCEAPEERATTTDYDLFARFPGWSREHLLKHGILDTRTIPAFQEPEEEFLRRHKLLTRAEAAALEEDEEGGEESPLAPSAKEQFRREWSAALGVELGVV